MKNRNEKSSQKSMSRRGNRGLEMGKVILGYGIMAIFMSLSLTACGSGDTAASTSMEEQTANTEAVTGEVAEVVGDEAVEVKEVIEPEPTPEDNKYMGIDMESTLPGIEWMDTFDGIINEPKLVVFSDETNKKIIVERGDTVEFSKVDTLAIYIPEGKEATLIAYDLAVFGKAEKVGRYILETELDEFWNAPKSTIAGTSIEYEGEKMHLKVELEFMD